MEVLYLMEVVEAIHLMHLLEVVEAIHLSPDAPAGGGGGNPPDAPAGGGVDDGGNPPAGGGVDDEAIHLLEVVSMMEAIHRSNFSISTRVAGRCIFFSRKTPLAAICKSALRPKVNSR